jgi:hypothetical protein
VEFDANNFFSFSDVESFSVSFDIRKQPDETANFIQNSWEGVPNDLQKNMDWEMLDDIVFFLQVHMLFWVFELSTFSSCVADFFLSLFMQVNRN